MAQLLKADVQVVSAGSISEDACSALRRLKVSNQKTWFNVKKVNITPVFISRQESDVRIIIGLYEESAASKVFCCVSTIYGQKHVTQVRFACPGLGVRVRGQGFADLNFCYRRIFPPEVKQVFVWKRAKP